MAKNVSNLSCQTRVHERLHVSNLSCQTRVRERLHACVALQNDEEVLSYYFAAMLRAAYVLAQS